MIASPVPTGFALIPAGTYTMGNVMADSDITDAQPHAVNVSAFYMARNLVTKAEWDTVRTWAVNNGYSDFAIGAGKAGNHPVHGVTWRDCIKYCNARSEMERLTPVYTVGGVVLKTGTANPTANWNANGYRLPTEAEWEKFARGGLSGKRFPWGDTISQTQANYRASSSYGYDLSGATNGHHPTYATGGEPYTSPVGSFPANGYGLNDMAGNLQQWCWDGYATYDLESPTDPRGGSISAQVFRGGSWNSSANACRVAFRWASSTDYATQEIGVRVARSSAP